MKLLNLPDEIVGYVAQRMDYPTLLKLMQTCRHFNVECWNTWRGQALLLGKPSFRTKSNYKTIFKTYIVNEIWEKDHCDVVDAGVNIVYAFYSKKPAYLRDDARMDRVRIILKNAMKVYRNELTGFEHDAEKKARLMMILSAIHTPIQVEVLLPKTGKTFRQVLTRMLDGYGVFFYVDDKKTIVDTDKYLVYGKLHPDDSFSSRPERFV